MVNYESASDEEGEYSEDEEVEMPNKQPKENAVYDIDGLHDKLEDIGWTDSTDWMQTLALTIDDPATEQADPNDDLSREMAFFTQALEGAKEAYIRLQTAGVPFLRPSDYYASMVKSDLHMLKIKDRLLHQQKSLEESEQRRKQREAKKYSKEVQAEKLKERAKEKKSSIESVKKWRKMRQSSDFKEGDDAFPIGLENEGERAEFPRGRKQGVAGDRSTPREGLGSRGPSKKRQARDTKFGFGGRKKLLKQNTADSSGDMSAFKASRKDVFGGGRGGRGGRGGGRGGAKLRPGKARRQNSKK